MVIVEPNIVAQSERLLLRPLRAEDAEDVLLMRKHPEVMKHTSIRSSDDIDKTRAWIQGCFDSPVNWNFSIELLPTAPQSTPTNASPRVIGLIGAVRAPEIGYMFNADHWGKGYATEALRAFMPLFFKHYSGNDYERFEYAEAHTDTELIASQNVLTKTGFVLFEKREKDFENPILGWRDTLIYRMYRPDAGNVKDTEGTSSGQ
ncbi:acyl-CoA N-acyltransferase [Pyrenochaeta sp. DS3sAY3a]|nr:acyl-CoA N-acyltransferase [Pyrenochaeta sp. DS3sAY3a]